MRQWIKEIIDGKEKLLKKLESSGYLSALEEAGEAMAQALRMENKLILAGNGGSAADAQHFAGEMTGRFMRERNALAAVSLCVDSSVVTSIANDYGYGEIFTRQLDGIGRSGDVFIAISTSGNSDNLIRAVRKAGEKDMKVVGLLGKNGGEIKRHCDYALVVPDDSVPRIQEIHTLSVHLLCELIERELFL